MHMLGTFVDQNLASIQLCMDYLIACDFTALSHELHKCKGNAGLFGADELYQTVLDMEEKLVVAHYETDAISTLLTQTERQLMGYRLWSKE
ncbi:MAG: HPt (histidine-containing phosphotransfer) domain-containing protein [Porticoccaceae bacterium]|jgi:HPt (histidine-containing phosphotransfer) domain-containing protein